MLHCLTISIHVYHSDGVVKLKLRVSMGLGQVKRVLRSGGKYACVTRAQNDVLGYSVFLNF